MVEQERHEAHGDDRLSDAVARYDEGDVEGCLALLRTLRESSQPLHGDAHYFEGLCERRRGNLQQALAAFRRAAENTPNDAEYLLEYALCLIAAGRVQEGLDTLRQAVHESGHAPAFRHELYLQNAIALYEEGYLESAILSLRKALKFVQDGVTYRLLSQILVEAGDVQGALKAAQEGVEHFSQDAEMHHTAGLALVAAKLMQEASEAFARAFELNSNDVESLYSLGICYEIMGDLPLAVRTLQRCLGMNLRPEAREETLNRLARIRRHAANQSAS